MKHAEILDSLGRCRPGLLLILITASGLFPSLGKAADPASLSIRILEGDGATYLRGSRATRGITVAIVDEHGAPVGGAIVSFSLPAEGPSGTFSNGTRTEIVTTKPDGKASVWGMQWNRSEGPVEIRVTAAMRQARAGLTATQFLTGTTQQQTASAAIASPSSQASSRGLGIPAPHISAPRIGGHKWVWITLAVTGAVVVGAGLAGSGGGSTSSASAAVSTVSIGTPTISLGRP